VGKLLNVFFDICLLRAGPQVLPASSFLLMATAILGLVTGTMVVADAFGDPFSGFLAQLLFRLFEAISHADLNNVERMVFGNEKVLTGLYAFDKLDKDYFHTLTCSPHSLP